MAFQSQLQHKQALGMAAVARLAADGAGTGAWVGAAIPCFASRIFIQDALELCIWLQPWPAFNMSIFNWPEFWAIFQLGLRLQLSSYRGCTRSFLSFSISQDSFCMENVIYTKLIYVIKGLLWLGRAEQGRSSSKCSAGSDCELLMS